MDDKLFIEQEDGKLEKTHLADKQAIMEAAQKYFSFFPQNTAQKSYEIWETHDKPEKW